MDYSVSTRTATAVMIQRVIRKQQQINETHKITIATEQ